MSRFEAVPNTSQRLQNQPEKAMDWPFPQEWISHPPPCGNGQSIVLEAPRTWLTHAMLCFGCASLWLNLGMEKSTESDRMLLAQSCALWSLSFARDCGSPPPVIGAILEQSPQL